MRGFLASRLFGCSLATDGKLTWTGFGGVLRGVRRCSTLNGGRDLGTRYDIGTWRIMPEGHVCRRWHVRDSQRERCYTGYREGEIFELYVKDRLGKEVYRRVPGNPEGY